MRAAAELALLAAGALVVAAVGCRQPAARELPRGGAEVAASAFRPPADGLLTDADLDLYVKVRRAAKGRTESDAAAAVGADPDRFGWVQARIVEALVALDARRVRDAAAETYGRTLAALRETRRSVGNGETARSLDAQIAQLERERAGFRRADPLPPRVAANARRVAARRSEIETLTLP